MITELFASPLMTGSECVPGEEGNFAAISLTRRDHLCTTLNTRLGEDNLCSFGGTVRALAAAVPEDGWARGAAIPDQATEPSLFYTSTLDSLCTQVANRMVNRNGSPLQSNDVEGSLNYMVERVLGLAPSDPLHTDVAALLASHYEDAGEIDGNARNRLRSTFIVACSSALMGSTDL
ncbi:MAG: hypothetical protein AAFY60_06595 [Myxococcota bacterium]